MNKPKFKKLLRKEINDGRFAVVSETIDGKISLAQQLRAKDENDKVMHLFLKNAFLFKDIETFEEFREELNKIDTEELKSAQNDS